MATARAAGKQFAASRAETSRFATEHRLAGINIGIAFLALAVGGLMGVLQALEYNGINLYPGLKTLGLQSYYQGLTIHGVLNVLVFTTFYIMGFLSFITAHAFDRPLNRPLAWATLGVMTIGLLMAAVPLLSNNATVMFTFYPPLQADFFFYLGLTLVVAGTWLLLINQIIVYHQWRKEHPNDRMPLAGFMSIVTMAMWTISTIGVASEMLFLLLPWAAGLTDGTDPLLARTLFWFTGHPIVYFWLLPAYISWYNFVPRQAGGRLFSDPMARVSFILFLVLSTPIGLHHQVTDPGISEIWKLVHAIFTFGVFFPSLLTFFNVNASMEDGGRARGGKGWLGWVFTLPWAEPSFVTQVLAMVLFAFGGAGGLINASYNVNLVVHNTAWIVGHFHLTVGSAVTLSFMGITYWLVPYLTKRALWSRRMGLIQAWTWLIGMGLFSHWLHTLGLLGMPRRTMMGASPYLTARPEWASLLVFVGIGAVLMFVSALLYYINMVMTITKGEPTDAVEIPWSKAISGPEDGPKILDRWVPWVTVALLLLAINYGPLLYNLISNMELIPGRRTW